MKSSLVGARWRRTVSELTTNVWGFFVDFSSLVLGNVEQTVLIRCVVLFIIFVQQHNFFYRQFHYNKKIENWWKHVTLNTRKCCSVYFTFTISLSLFLFLQNESQLCSFLTDTSPTWKLGTQRFTKLTIVLLSVAYKL